VERLRHIFLVVTILLGCVGCDQATKSLARDHLQGQAPVSFLGGAVRLEYAENPGAFLSLGASLPHHLGLAVFTIGGTIAVLGILLYALIALPPGSLRASAVALVSAGGIGNLIDRILHDGRVTDFLYIGVGPAQTGIFNVADVTLMAGLTLFVLAYRPSERSEDAAERL
jgi:signal peptidase II